MVTAGDNFGDGVYNADVLVEDMFYYEPCMNRVAWEQRPGEIYVNDPDDFLIELEDWEPKPHFQPVFEWEEEECGFDIP